MRLVYEIEVVGTVKYRTLNLNNALKKAKELSKRNNRYYHNVVGFELNETGIRNHFKGQFLGGRQII